MATTIGRLFANGTLIVPQLDEVSFPSSTKLTANTTAFYYPEFDEVTSIPIPLRQRTTGLIANGVFDEITQLVIAAFSDFTFTNAGQVASVGPSLAQATTAYAGNGQFNENDTAVFNVTNGYQTFVVPAAGTYRFTVAGASGGVWTTNPADATTAALMPTIDGYPRMPGASIVGTYSLNAGDIITMVIGHGGGDDTNTVANCPGGGGGTFVALGSYTDVVNAIDTLLFAAGGGGGCGYQSLDTYSVALGAASYAMGIGQSGTSGASSGQPGGASGDGTASAAGTNSNGGAGYLTNAPTSLTTPSFGGAAGVNGYAFRKGAKGATATGSLRGFGGFGGGGGGASTTTSDDDKGGGGGYSGGGYAFDAHLCGGGGGSYAISGSSATITAGGNLTGRHGSVRIEKIA